MKNTAFFKKKKNEALKNSEPPLYIILTGDVLEKYCRYSSTPKMIDLW